MRRTSARSRRRSTKRSRPGDTQGCGVAALAERKGDAVLGGLDTQVPPGTPAHYHVVVDELGGRASVLVVDVPAAEFGKIAFLHDPQGGVIGLFEELSK